MTPDCTKGSHEGVENVNTYLPVAAERQVYGQAEKVVHKVLEGRKQMPHLLL